MVASTVRSLHPGGRVDNVPKHTARAMVREAGRIAKRERSDLLLVSRQYYHRSPCCYVERVDTQPARA